MEHDSHFPGIVCLYMGPSCAKPSVVEEHRRVLKTMMPPDAYWIGSSVLAVARKDPMIEDSVAKMEGAWMSPREIAEIVLEKIHAANVKKAVEISVLGCSVGVVLPLWTAQRAFETFSSQASIVSFPVVLGEPEGCLTMADTRGQSRALTMSFCAPAYSLLSPSWLVAHVSPLSRGLSSEILETFEHCTVSLISEGETLSSHEGAMVISAYVGTPSCHATLAVSSMQAQAIRKGCRRVVLIGSAQGKESLLNIWTPWTEISAHNFRAHGEKSNQIGREERIEQGVLKILDILSKTPALDDDADVM